MRISSAQSGTNLYRSFSVIGDMTGVLQG